MRGQDILDLNACSLETKPVEIINCPSENCISSPKYTWEANAWGPVCICGIQLIIKCTLKAILSPFGLFDFGGSR